MTLIQKTQPEEKGRRQRGMGGVPKGMGLHHRRKKRFLRPFSKKTSKNLSLKNQKREKRRGGKGLPEMLMGGQCMGCCRKKATREPHGMTAEGPP